MLDSVLRNDNCKSVMELGCGEGAVMGMLCGSSDFIESLVGVDISADSLDNARKLLQPTPADFQDLRPRPLRVQLFEGSLCDLASGVIEGVGSKCRDLAPDAIACMEVIEHLHAEQLIQFPQAVMSLRVPIVVISTPNREFNVHFPAMQLPSNHSDYRQFRDADHKFEWTRQEFQKWCTEVATTFGYAVDFTGCGILGTYDDNIGYATQCAIFRLGESITELFDEPEANSATESFDDHEASGTWRQVLDVTFPHFDKPFDAAEFSLAVTDQVKLSLQWMSGLTGAINLTADFDLWRSLQVQQWSGGERLRLQQLLREHFKHDYIAVNHNGSQLTISQQWPFVLQELKLRHETPDNYHDHEELDEREWLHQNIKPLRKSDMTDDNDELDEHLFAMQVFNCAPRTGGAYQWSDFVGANTQEFTSVAEVAAGDGWCEPSDATITEPKDKFGW